MTFIEEPMKSLELETRTGWKSKWNDSLLGKNWNFGTSEDRMEWAK